MKLFISGKKFKTQKDPPRVIKTKAFLHASKDGELFGTDQLAAALNSDASVLRQSNVQLAEFFCLHKGKKYWGKPKTIKQLIKELSKP